MLDTLWIVPALPLAGFVFLALAGGRIPRTVIAFIATATVGISALLAIAIGVTFLGLLPQEASYRQVLWQWVSVAGFEPAIGFHLDALSLVMMFVVTFVAFWIHLYSTEFMIEDEAYGRFFAYMNLFVASMLILVLADNLLLLYLGWEGVGACSYLLIGFWYHDSANGRAAQKAFIVTRVGDTAMAIALFLLFVNFGTLDIQAILQQASESIQSGSLIAVAVTALLLGGAVGKSAQLPLQTWLPDAMAGPTPVSALIHAATMVTAGVYLIARTHTLYSLAPQVMAAVAGVGALTLFIAGTAALVQRDIKRVLAYSTISQIGYMFLALGVGAWGAAMFHFMTHAFFKALLFLAAGAVINALHHEHDIFKMGGVRHKLPLVFWTFLIGSASLAGFPLVTAGFYSKDLILWQAWSSGQGQAWLWAIGVATAFLTAIYIFRVVFIVFFGKERTHVEKLPRRPMTVPLVVLAFFSIVSGFVEIPPALGGRHLFSSFMSSALPSAAVEESHTTELIFSLIASLLALAGIYLAHLFFRTRREHAEPDAGKRLTRFLFGGWGFDWLYDRIFVRPFVWIARVNRNDYIDSIYGGIAALSRGLNTVFSSTETGRVRLYAAGIACGSIILVAIALLL
ncbi:MAG: NADH-quinone oxidoreductase subunit L [Acidobacteria bacterium]|nr:NADH-quinone oxidoreductase subunit L [Acidobacteriota bacterium]